MTTEHDGTRSETETKRPTSPPDPIPALQLVDRAQLRASLKPLMAPATFANWLHRVTKQSGFPPPVRTGLRSVSWSVQEVTAWLASRPRGGTFDGVRRQPKKGAAFPSRREAA